MSAVKGGGRVASPWPLALPLGALKARPAFLPSGPRLPIRTYPEFRVTTSILQRHYLEGITPGLQNISIEHSGRDDLGCDSRESQDVD